MSQTKQGVANLWQTVTQYKSNCQRMHNSPPNCKTDHSGFCAHETHRHVMQQNENSCKTHDSWQQTKTKFHKSKFCPVRNRPKLWNSKTSQNIAPSQSELDSSRKTAFAFLLADVWWLPSLALPPGLVPLQKPIHVEDISSVLRWFGEHLWKICITNFRADRTPRIASFPANGIR